MGGSEHDPLIPRGGTAVIVVAGVGDDRPGDTVGSMTGAMLKVLGDGAGSTGYRRQIVVPPGPGGGGATTHEVHSAVVTGPGIAAPLVVYEMHWGDLSRFSNRALRFLLTLYGLLFQVGTVGLEAFRKLGTRSRERVLLRVFSYLTVVVVVALIAGAALLGVEFAILVRVDSAAAEIVVGAGIVAAALGLAVYGGRWMLRWGWRFSELGLLSRPMTFFLAVALGVGAGPLAFRIFGDDDGQAIAVHETLWLMVRVIQPVAWALVGLVAVGVAAMLASAWWRETPRYHALRTTALSVVVGGLGIALLGALLVAVVLGVVSRAVDPDDTLVPAEAARQVGSDDLTFGGYAGAVFARSLEPLGLILPCALGLILVAAIAAFSYVAALAQRDAPRTRAIGGWLPIGVAVVTAIAMAALLYADRDWADGVAVILPVIPLGVAAWWTAVGFRRPGRQPVREGFDRLLRYLGGDLHVLLLCAALIVSALALLAAVPIPGGDGAGRPWEGLLAPVADLAGGSEGTTAGSLVLVAITTLAAFAAGRLPVLARAMDVAYDVATYVRVTHGSPGRPDGSEPPRRRVLRRYAALLRHIDAAQGPARIVIVAHSQGSMYTLALLFRDEFRDEADIAKDDRWKVAPALRSAANGHEAESPLAVGAPILLLTAGCPIVQTYEPNFPLQYAWPRDARTTREKMRGTPVELWRNVYRSGDYFGRALWGARACAAPSPDGLLQQWCIGVGHHTGYWSEPVFARHALELAGVSTVGRSTSP